MSETTETKATEQTMERIKLTRTGERDLIFRGAKLAEASEHEHQGPRQNRWAEVKVFEVEGGGFVARAIHRTCWQGEQDTFHAWPCADPEAVAKAFEDHFQGMPSVVKEVLGEAFEGDVGVEHLGQAEQAKGA